MVFHKHEEGNEIAYEDMRDDRCTLCESSYWNCVLKHVIYGGWKILTHKTDWHFWYSLSIRLLELLKWRRIQTTTTRCRWGTVFRKHSISQVLSNGVLTCTLQGHHLFFRLRIFATFFFSFPYECRDVIYKYTMTVFSPIFSISLYITMLSTVLILNVVHSLYSEFKISTN
jgi:hypothetical protein